MNFTTLQQHRKEGGQTLTELLIWLVMLLFLGAVLIKLALDWIIGHPLLSSFAFGFLLALVPMWKVAGKDNETADGLGMLLVLGLIFVLVVYSNRSDPPKGAASNSSSQSPASTKGALIPPSPAKSP